VQGEIGILVNEERLVLKTTATRERPEVRGTFAMQVILKYADPLFR